MYAMGQNSCAQQFYAILLIIGTLLAITGKTEGQGECNSCVSDTEFTLCSSDGSVVVPCRIFGTGLVCVPNAPRSNPCLNIPPACTQAGNFRFQNTLEDCDRYYECDASLTATTKFCPTGQAFSVSTQRCVVTEMADCLSASSGGGSSSESSTKDVTSANNPTEVSQSSETSASDTTVVNTAEAVTDVTTQANTAEAGSDSTTASNTADSTSNAGTSVTDITTASDTEPSVTVSTASSDTASSATDSTASNVATSVTDSTTSSNTGQTVPDSTAASNTASTSAESPSVIPSTTPSNTAETPTRGTANTETPVTDSTTVSNTESTTGSTPTTVSTTNTPTTTTIATTTGLPSCRRRGYREADPKSCYRYLYCTFKPRQGLVYTSIKCPFFMVFDTRWRSCRFMANCGNRPRV